MQGRYRKPSSTGMTGAVPHRRSIRLIIAAITVLSLIVPLVPRSNFSAAVAHAQDGTQPTGLPITFTSTTSNVCSISDTNLVTLISAGTCTIEASQPGDSQYNAASPVDQSFQVGPAATTVTPADATVPYDDQVTLSAAVHPTALAGQIPTGTVAFAINGSDAGSTTVDSSGAATNAPVTVTLPPGTYTILATFKSSNPSFKDSVGSSRLTVTKEDTVLTYSGDTSGIYDDVATLKTTLLEDGDPSRPMANRQVGFTLGSQGCTGTTDSNGVASCSITPAQAAGANYQVVAAFTGDTNYDGSSTSTPFTINKEDTTVSYTGAKLIAQGRSATLSALLKEDGTTPIAGRSLTLTLGSGTTAQSCTTAATTAAGSAGCTIAAVNQPYGNVSITAAFAGDDFYLPSSDATGQALIFGYLGSGSFVLGNTTATSALGSGAPVTWWGAQWSSLNTLSGGAAPDSFKGFAASTSTAPPNCGGTWSTDPGNSPPPPASVPPYMAVIASSTIAKSGSIISGDSTQIVIVKTDAGYAANPGHAGTGTVVAVLCSSTSSHAVVRSHTGSHHRVRQPRQHSAHHATHRTGHLVPVHFARHRSSSVRTHHAATRTVGPASRPASLRHTGRMQSHIAGSKLDQTIVFNGLPDKTFGDAPFRVTAVSVTVLPSGTITLAPSNAGPNVTGSSQTLKATLLDGSGNPEPNVTVTFTVSGANTASETAPTDGTGVASFAYTGQNHGTDTVQASAVVRGATLQSNTASVNWITPVQPVTTTTITGRFFTGGAGAFTHHAGDTPAFTQSFPTIDFNPPAGTVPGIPNKISINQFTRPFTDVTTDVGGNFNGYTIAQGNGHQAGVGDMSTFDAVFDATLAVAQAGDITFNFYSDDGFILGVGNGATRVSGANTNMPSTSPFNGYPVMGAFNDPTSPRANAITVHFPGPGTYPYEVDYSECCFGELAMTVATTNTGHGIAPAGNLSLTPTLPANQTVGQPVNLTVAAMDASGQPLPSLPVTLQVTGVNTQQVTGTTDSAGLATLSYVGTNPGSDHAQIGANVSGMPAVSNLISVPWVYPSSSGGGTGGGGGGTVPPPSISSPTPADGTIVTKPIPITASFAPPAGATITSWKVTYQALDPEPPVTLASGSGPPPSTLATFDPTLLPNDTYAITVSATASNGGTQTATSTVAVSGNLKLGRFTTTYQDMSVPVNGFQMQVLRSYDSYDKRVGDFGYGWHVSVANFRASTNRQLGAGGWSEYPSRCAFFCQYAFATSAAHFVTVTFPDSHQEVFDFTPSGGVGPFYFMGNAAFTARPGTGTTSTLAPVGGSDISYGFDGNIYSGLFGPLYAPTQFRLTTRDGRVLLLDTQAGLLSETDPNGNTLTLNSTGIHSSSNESILYTRDGQGRISDINGPGGLHLHYDYNAAGDLVDDVDSKGTTTYNYTGNHDLQSVIGPGNTPLVSLQYATDGRLQSVQHGTNPPETITNDVGAQTQSYTDPMGRLTVVDSFDDRGDLTGEQLAYNDPATGTPRTLSSSWQYDADGRQLSSQDQLGHITSNTYDGTGNLIQSTDPAGHVTQFAYNSLGQLTSETAVTGSGPVSLYAAQYDARGNLTETDRPDGSAYTFGYDAAGNPVQITDPLGRGTHLVYDAAGHVSQVTDSAGNSSFYTTDAAGNLLTVKDADSNTTTYAYDASGDVTDVYDAKGNHQHLTYDALDRLTQTTDALGRSINYSYDAAGNLAGVTDRDGRATAYGYDGDGELHTVTVPSGVSTYNYDPLGRLVEADNANATLHFSYDDAGRLISQKSEGTTSASQPAVTLQYSYDAANNLQSVSGPQGTTQYQYDELSRLRGIVDPRNRSFGFGYDALSRLTNLTRPNGVNDTLRYDKADELLSRTASLNSAPVTSSTYTYDNTGLRNSLTTSAGTASYAHDAAGQLLSATYTAGTPANESYQYDRAGNRIASAGVVAGAMQYDANNRLQTDATNTYTYDNEGELVAKTATSANKTTQYGWDGLGQLTSITYPDSSSTSYRYDPFGRRIEVNDNGKITRYVYNGDNMMLEYDGSNTLTASFVQRGGTDTPLAMERGGQSYYYLQDGMGNISALTDSAGAVVDSYTYDAFGRQSSTGTVNNPFSYTGREYDAKSGLYYYRARYYDPQTGRFLSEDPLPAVNPYPYVHSNPTDYLDPTGGQEMVEESELDAQAAEEAPAIQRVGCAVSIVLSAAAAYLESAGDPTAVAIAVVTDAVAPGSKCSAKATKRSRHIPNSVKRRVDADNPTNTCRYCGREGSAKEYDHREPWSKGGSNDYPNIDKICRWCNRSKGNGPAPKNPPPNPNVP